MLHIEFECDFLVYFSWWHAELLICRLMYSTIIYRCHILHVALSQMHSFCVFIVSKTTQKLYNWRIATFRLGLWYRFSLFAVTSNRNYKQYIIIFCSLHSKDKIRIKRQQLLCVVELSYWYCLNHKCLIMSVGALRHIIYVEKCYVIALHYYKECEINKT